MLYKKASSAWQRIAGADDGGALVNGDCSALLAAIPDGKVSLVLTSPPYCVGKSYERGKGVEDFIADHERILPEVVRVLKPGGSFCWQVGYHVEDNVTLPLDYLIFDAVRKLKPTPVLRNRIVWTFGHGLHGGRRFSGRHEIILWFTKGSRYTFDLDAVRVQQKYPGKKASRGPLKGEYSGNPKGKNPEDVWEIPNVKANHVEKTDHPCQFPVALAQRLVRALTKRNEIVLDPYAGVGSSGVAALLEKRRFIGSEINEKYASIAAARLKSTKKGTIKVRPDIPVQPPDPRSHVAQRPNHFWVVK